MTLANTLDTSHFPGGERTAWTAPFELDAEHVLSFDEAIARIEAALRLGIDPSLEPIRALLAELGHPEDAFVSVQVAGTNGKTSTARYTAALLNGEGLRCGLYTSPHLVDYTERVEVAGKPVTQAIFARGVSRALAAWECLEARGDTVCAQGCTEFELLTAAAMVIFAEQGIDVAVLEVGLGGRWDATSAVPTVACAITGIGLDHLHILGDTLEAIAAEKAPVIHRGAGCILGVNATRPAEVREVLLGRCAEQGVVPTVVVDAGAIDADSDNASEQLQTLPQAAYTVTHMPSALGDKLVLSVTVGADPNTGSVYAAYPDISLIAPAYQAQNVACAMALATAVYGRSLDVSKAQTSLMACSVPGRFEIARTDPLVLLDACHNPQSATACAEALVQAMPVRSVRPTLLLGALSDKDHRGIAAVLAPLFDRIVVTQSTSPRAVPAHELAEEIRDICGQAPEAVFDRASEALRYLAMRPFICCGTITLIGEVKALLAS